MLLTLCMVLGLLPGMTLTASATGATEVSTWAELKSAFNNGGDVTLTGDVTAQGTDSALVVPEGKTVTLDLNGHTINRSLASPADDKDESANKKGNAIIVNGTLTVNDTSESKQGKITGAYSKREYFKCGAIYVASGGNFTLNAGSISGNKAGIEGEISWHYGAGVSVDNGGTFTMNGGSISGNHSSWLGGGMASDSGATVNLLGGKIEKNTTSGTKSGACLGGGVAAYGNVTIGGDIVIQNNTAKDTTNNLHFMTWNKYLQLSAAKPLETSAKIGWTGPPNSTVDAQGIKVAQGTNAKDYLDRFISDQNSDYIFGLKAGDAETIYCATANSTVVTKPVARNVEITAGQHMTKTQDSGNASQTVTASAITDIVYTAETGYYFPENYVSSISGLTDGALNGISVTRNSETQITVSGTPTADTTITLEAAAEISEPTFNDGFGNANITSGSYTVGHEYDVGSGTYEFAGWYASADYSGSAVTEFTNGTTYYAKWTKNGKTVRTTSLDLTRIGEDNTFGATLTGGVYTNDAEGWSWNTATNTLTLSGCNFNIVDTTGTDGFMAIKLPAESTINLASGTENIVVSSSSKQSGAIGAATSLTIEGDGTLGITSSFTGIIAGGNIAINSPITVKTTSNEEYAMAITIESENRDDTITIADTLEITTPVGGKIHSSGKTILDSKDNVAKEVVIGVAKKYTVTYNTNGGSAVVSATVSEGHKLTAPEAPTKDGYTFHGWYKDAAFTNRWNFDTDTVTEDVTLYAKWSVEPVYSISGTVKKTQNDDSETAISGATVELKKGTDVIASVKTDENGSYTFTYVPSGEYNIVVTNKAGDQAETMTQLVTVSNANQGSRDIILPKGSVSAVVEVKPNTPAVLAGGLDAEAKAEDGKKVTVKLVVESKAEADASGAAEIKQIASGKTLEYLDLAVQKTVDNVTTAIDQTNNVLEIVVPFQTSGRNNITVYRHHASAGSTAETKALTRLDTRPTSSYTDETYYVGDGYVVIYAQKFSTYAIGYNTQSGGGSGSGGSSSGGGSSSSSGSSSSGNSSTISTPSAKNGTVSVSPKSASKGTTVTVTVTPDKGYVLETLTVTDASGKKLDLKNLGSGKYSFTMPASKVEVKATFMEDNTMLNYFVDVPASAYYYDAVLWAAEQGITGGTDATHFSPDGVCTRAQAVTFLWRAAGSPAPSATAMPFTDGPLTVTITTLCCGPWRTVSQWERAVPPSARI